MVQIVSSSRYKLNKKHLKSECTTYLGEFGYGSAHSLNIAFVGRNKMREVAAKYKEENVALPVLSFTYNQQEEDHILLGEVVICYPQAVLLAAQRQKKVDDMILQLAKHGIDNILKSL